jgi:hypothetical protein
MLQHVFSPTIPGQILELGPAGHVQESVQQDPSPLDTLFDITENHDRKLLIFS